MECVRARHTVAAAGLMLAGCSSIDVRVRNDSPTPVRISSCVDDSADVAHGGIFDAQGVPDHDTLACLVTPPSGQERCVAFLHVSAIRGSHCPQSSSQGALDSVRLGTHRPAVDRRHLLPLRSRRRRRRGRPRAGLSHWASEVDSLEGRSSDALTAFPMRSGLSSTTTASVSHRPQSVIDRPISESVAARWRCTRCS